MAAIDSLLALIEAQKRPGSASGARAAGPHRFAGSWPDHAPLDAGILDTFAAEALAPDDLERLRASGACDAVYRSERHGAFAVEARLNADKLSLKLLRSGAVLAKPAPTVPLTRALPACLPPLLMPRSCPPQARPSPAVRPRLPGWRA